MGMYLRVVRPYGMVRSCIVDTNIKLDAPPAYTVTRLGRENPHLKSSTPPAVRAVGPGPVPATADGG